MTIVAATQRARAADPQPGEGSLLDRLAEPRVFSSKERSWDNNVALGHYLVPPNELEVPLSAWHSLGIQQGAAVRHVQKQDGITDERVFTRGIVVIVPAGTTGYSCWSGVSEHIVIHLPPALLERVAEESRADPSRIEQVGLALKAELETDGLGGKLYVESLANVLAVHLLRHYSSLGTRDAGKMEVERARPSRLPEDALRRVLGYVADNLSGNLSLAEMAREARMSIHHFSRLFKESTGLAPYQYVLRERVEKAKELLLGGGLSSAEVAYEVGFYDQAHLTRHVKRLLGVTPGQILKESKNIQNDGDSVQYQVHSPPYDSGRSEGRKWQPKRKGEVRERKLVEGPTTKEGNETVPYLGGDLARRKRA